MANSDEAQDSMKVILERRCHIERGSGDVDSLIIQFTKPENRAEYEFVGSVHFLCKFFDKTLRVTGADDIQVIVQLLSLARVVLENYEEAGYSIWWLEKGDLHHFDFWGGSQFQREFCLPSAINDSMRRAFHAANEGKHLMPSHRVGIEPDRPAITIYKVNADGSDRLGCVIGPEEMKGHTWETLEQLVGERILWDSREGVEMMIALQPDRIPEADG